MLIVNVQWRRLLLLPLVVFDQSVCFVSFFVWLIVGWCCFCSSLLAVTVDAFVASCSVAVAVVAVDFAVVTMASLLLQLCGFVRSGWY
jgi:hypothetical protein